jgi:hypothetical protein
VNGKPCREAEPGKYVRGVINLLPILPVRVRVECPGFSEEYSLGIQLCLGNIGAYVAAVAAIVVFYSRGMLKKA